MKRRARVPAGFILLVAGIALSVAAYGSDLFWLPTGWGDWGGSGNWTLGFSPFDGPKWGTAWDTPYEDRTDWVPTQTAVFGGFEGNVSIPVNIDAGAGLRFEAGYILGGPASLNLTGVSSAVNSINVVDSVTVTIGAWIAGSSGMTKDGPGTLILEGISSYPGRTVLAAGTLQVGTAWALPASGEVVFAGGTLVVADWPTFAGALSLQADSTLYLGSQGLFWRADLTFESAAPWGGGTLKVSGWGGPDGTKYGRLLITSDPTASGILDHIQFTDHAVGASWIAATGEVVPYVEPFRVFAATSRNQQALLQWVNPATAGCSRDPFTAVIRTRSDGTYPVTRTDGIEVTETEQTCGDTSKGSTLHSSLVNSTKYLYSAFASGPNGTWSERKTTWARPLDSSAGKVKWTYTTGALAMVQPGNNPVPGASTVLFVSNDRVLHSAVSGASGGAWPDLFVPQTMNDVSQAWPTVVPGVAGVDRVAFIPSHDGRVYARNVATGAEVWSSSTLGDALQGGVAGVFAQYGGPSGVNRLFVGTRNTSNDNEILGIDAATGNTAWSFSTGAIGIVSSMPAVEYPSGKVFVTSRQKSGGTAQTLWCLTHAGSVCTGWPVLALGDIDASPGLRSGSVYVGNNAGQIYRVNAATGSIVWGPTETGDGAVRSGLWVDETAGLVHFSTGSKVWAIPVSSGLTAGGWSVSISSPSYPIKVNGEIYVGSGDGRLYQIHGSTGAVASSVLLGDGTAAVGVPTCNALDQMIYVGSEAGVIYAVQVPLQ